MKNKYVEDANKLKALADPNRLMIIKMLSYGELCACKILEDLNITQPTLSHHMKILSECGLVDLRREGKWIHYSLNIEKMEKIKQIIVSITTSAEKCIDEEERVCK